LTDKMIALVLQSELADQKKASEAYRSQLAANEAVMDALRDQADKAKGTLTVSSFKTRPLAI